MEIMTNPYTPCLSSLTHLTMTQINCLTNSPLTTFWIILRSCCPTGISYKMLIFFTDHLTLLIGLWVSTTRIQSRTHLCMMSSLLTGKWKNNMWMSSLRTSYPKLMTKDYCWLYLTAYSNIQKMTLQLIIRTFTLEHTLGRSAWVKQLLGVIFWWCACMVIHW